MGVGGGVLKNKTKSEPSSELGERGVGGQYGGKGLVVKSRGVRANKTERSKEQT